LVIAIRRQRVPLDYLELGGGRLESDSLLIHCYSLFLKADLQILGII